MKPFDMEEIIPIVTELTGEYKKVNTEDSITYDLAKQLMGAVMFCIAEEQKFGTDTMTLVADQKKSIRESYNRGYEILLTRMQRIQRAYDRTAVDFNDYGSVVYRETFYEGIPGFLGEYDPRYYPQDSILTMKYPTIIPVDSLKGIEAIYRYVQYIQLEQKFLHRLPELYVRRLLETITPGYKEQNTNICNLVLRSLIGCVILGRNPGDGLYTEKEYRKIKKFVRKNRKKDIRKVLTQMVRQIVVEGFGGDMGMYHYLAADMKDFAQELVLAAEINDIEALLVM